MARFFSPTVWTLPLPWIGVGLVLLSGLAVLTKVVVARLADLRKERNR